MTWALKRQMFYLVVLFVFIAVFVFLIIHPFNQTPTCTDNKQNGTEAGVDCGGICARACIFQADEVAVLWARSFRVIAGRYNAVAYLENHNKNIAVNKINYRFRFADKNNVYIGKREGSTFIPASGKFAVFEPGIDIGNSIPVYTTFEFTEVPQWAQVPSALLKELEVLVSNITFATTDGSSVLSATIKNNSLFSISDIGVVVILYDASGNAVSTSRTYLDSLGAEERQDIHFTWPESLWEGVVAKEIIPMFNIFSVKLK